MIIATKSSLILYNNNNYYYYYFILRKMQPKVNKEYNNNANTCIYISLYKIIK